VVLNTSVDPWKCLPDLTTSTAKKAVSAVPNAILNQFHKTKLAKKLSKVKIGGLPLVSTTPMMASTNNLRIKSFDVINGIYSIEWIYVLMYCAIKCQQNVTYDEDSNQYTYSCKTGVCCQQCMLFNDPYLISQNYSGTTNFDAVPLMANYTGIRNFTFAYAPIKSLNHPVNKNECECMATSKYCPGTLITECGTPPGDPVSDYYYRGSNIINTDCPDKICNYCDVSVIQVAAAAKSGEATGNTNYASIDQQCQTNNCGTGGDGKPGDQGGDGGDPDEDSDPSTTNWKAIIGLLILGLVIAVIVVVLVVLYIRHKKKKEAST
jgi:hypothetical protein